MAAYVLYIVLLSASVRLVRWDLSFDGLAFKTRLVGSCSLSDCHCLARICTYLWLYTSIATSLDESFLLFGWCLLLRPRRMASSECQASDGFELCRIVSYRRREEALLSQWQARRRFETLTRQGRPSSRAFYWSFRLDAKTKGSYTLYCMQNEELFGSTEPFLNVLLSIYITPAPL